MSTVDINAPTGWYITYKAGTGRSIAYGNTFATQESAQAVLDSLSQACQDKMHVIEVKP
jgi:hypothetical protein